MKLKLFLSLFVMVFAFATANASFPVKRVAKTTADTEVTVDATEAELYSPAAASMAYNKWVAVALWFLFRMAFCCTPLVRWQTYRLEYPVHPYYWWTRDLGNR